MTTELWNHYSLALQVDRLTAGLPANPKLLQAWLEVNNAPAEATADHEARLDRLDPELTHGLVFYRNLAGAPCYEGRCMKAALKEGANILKTILDIKSFRSKLAERVFVGPKLVPIDAPIQTDERPLSVMTAMGPRTSIKRFEYADNVRLDFTLRVLTDGVVKEAHLRTILEYLQENGIGADRAVGSGTFKLLSFAGA